MRQRILLLMVLAMALGCRRGGEIRSKRLDGNFMVGREEEGAVSVDRKWVRRVFRMEGEPQFWVLWWPYSFVAREGRVYAVDVRGGEAKEEGDVAGMVFGSRHGVVDPVTGRAYVVGERAGHRYAVVMDTRTGDVLVEEMELECTGEAVAIGGGPGYHDVKVVCVEAGRYGVYVVPVATRERLDVRHVGDGTAVGEVLVPVVPMARALAVVWQEDGRGGVVDVWDVEARRNLGSWEVDGECAPVDDGGWVYMQGEREGREGSRWVRAVSVYHGGERWVLGGKEGCVGAGGWRSGLSIGLGEEGTVLYDQLSGRGVEIRGLIMKEGVVVRHELEYGKQYLLGVRDVGGSWEVVEADLHRMGALSQEGRVVPGQYIRWQVWYDEHVRRSQGGWQEPGPEDSTTYP